MSINPLIDDFGDDSDIIESPKKKKNNKKISITEIRGPNGEKLPQAIQEALRTYLDTSRTDAEEHTPIEFRAISHIIDNWSKMHTWQVEGATLVAVCEVLDGMTDGVFSQLVDYHQSRRVIIYTTITEKVVRGLMNIMDPGDTKEYTNELWLFLDVYLDFIYFTKERAIKKYRQMCEEVGRDVDENFIETGILASRNNWERTLFSRPSAYEDE